MILASLIGLAGHANAQTPQTITNFAPVTPTTFSVGKTIALTATGGGSGNAVVFSSATTSICTVAGATATVLSVGTCTLRANQTGNATFSAAPQVSRNVVVNKGSQTITFGALAAKNYGATPFAISATASSTLAVTFTSTTTARCTVAGSTVTIVGIGTCTIAANQAGNTNFNAATQVTQTFTISKGAQTITFAALSGKTYGIAPFTVSATASSALAVTFTSTTTARCTVAGSTVTIVGIGTCTIAANQAGNTNYNAATQVTQTFTISKGAQTITFAALANKVIGSAAFSVSASATSALAVSFTSTTTSKCTVAGSTVTLVATGTCTIAANQAGNANYNAAPQVTQSFTVTSAALIAQTITNFSPATPLLYSAGGTFLLSATGGASGNAVIFASTTPTVCTVTASTVSLVSVGTCTLTANQAGNATYSAASQVSASVVITKASQTISFGALANKTVGNAAFAVSATATSTLAVIFTSTTTTKCTVAGSTVTLVAAGTCTIAANQAGNANYNAATQVSQSFTIAKANQTISFASLAAKTLGAPAFAVSASASSALAVSFSSSTASICTVSGTTVSLVSAGTCTIAANQGGNANYNAATTVSQSFAVAPAALIAQTITNFLPDFSPDTSVQYSNGGTFTLSANGGASSIAIVFASTTAAVCTVATNIVSIISAGTCTLTANQAGNVTYSAAPQVSLAVTVTKADQTIAFSTLPSKLLTSMPFIISATATSALAVSFSTTTTAVCTVASNTVTIVSLGVCTIAANQVGNGNYNAAPQTTQSFNVVNGISAVYSAPLALGQSHTCAIDNTNGLKCWGWNELGQLGDNSIIDRSTPVDVVGLTSGIAAVSAGVAHSCAVTTSGGAKCWGNNYYGQLGDATNNQQNSPVDVIGLQSGVMAITAGSGHTCVITTVGGVKCWGDNSNGQLGDGTGLNQATPVDVVGLGSGVVDIRAGGTHTCAVTADGQLKCWGANYQGQLADGTTTSQPTPITVANFVPGLVGVESGYYHSCALTSAGGVKCWGENIYGQVGAGDNVNKLIPTDVVGLSSGISAIANGYYTSCGITTTGQLKCWGSLVGSNVPVNNDTFINGVIEVGLGNGHTCVMITGGGVRCWGSNNYGQVGNGTTDYQFSPIPPIGLAGMVGISQTINFPPLPNQNLGDSSVYLNASSTSSLPVTFASTTNAVCTVADNFANFVALGICTITASQLGDGNYGPAPQVNRSFNISIGTQVITGFTPPTPISYPQGGVFYLSANGGASGNPVVFGSTTPLVCTISDGNMVTVLAAGDCTLTANQAGNTSYSSAPQITATVVIQKVAQSISFWPLPEDIAPRPFTIEPSPLSAASSSNLAVSFASLTPTVCSVAGTSLTLISVGICSVIAEQAGDIFYLAAPSVSRSFMVAQATQTITQFSAASGFNIFYSLNGTFNLSAQGGASQNPVLFTSTTPLVCTINGNTAAIITAGSCVIAADQAGDINNAPAAQAIFSVTINKANQSLFLSFGGVTTVVYAASQTRSVVLSRFNSDLTLPVIIVSNTPTVCTHVPSVGSDSYIDILIAGECQLTATQAGNANYNAASATATLTITKATQVISGFTPATPIAFTQGGTFTLTANGSNSGVVISYASSTPLTCSVSGNIATMLAAGNCTLTANQVANVSYTAAPTVSATVLLEIPTEAISAPRIVTSALPPAIVGLPYSGKIVVSASYAVMSASVSGLPSGMTASHNGSGTISLSGTPSAGAVGTFPFVVTATNASGTVMLPAQIQLNAPLTNISSLSAGGSHSCAIKDGGVTCWGSNANGQLGNGTTITSAIPVAAIAAASGASVVSAKANNTCAVVAGGVMCWGSIASATPTSIITAGSSVTDVAVGLTHACAVVAGGVQCWGNNSYAQLGNGNSGNATSSATPVTTIAANSGATAVSAGERNSCAVVNGGVRCWGSNDLYALGVLAPNASNIPIVAIPDGSGVTAISTSISGFSCVVVNGGARCWGIYQSGVNIEGQVTIFNNRFAANSGVVAVGAGTAHTCVAVAGSVLCWGNNSVGQLGIGYTDNRNRNGFFESPSYPLIAGIGIGAGGNAVSIAVGNVHNCAAVGSAANNIVTCWGSNGAQLGDVTPSRNIVPSTSLSTASGVSGVGAGASTTCTVAGGGVQCWGLNDKGQLGYGSNFTSLAPLTAIAAGSNATSISSGNEHTCAVVNGGIQCWGNNNNGQLGNGNNAQSFAPLPVNTVSGATLVANGRDHTCAIIAGGAQCWGNNSSGQLGNASFASSNSPVVVSTATAGVTAIAAGSNFSCAVISGSVKCWGSNNFGKLGNGTNTQSNTPVTAVAANATTVATGSDHACAVVAGGVQCWGFNSNGQLGIIGTTSSNTPVTVIVAASGATHVAAGQLHTCAVIAGGVQCWGDNTDGQLGNGTTARSNVPVSVIPAGSGVSGISAGVAHTCAVIHGGTLCWGGNYYGQTGIDFTYPQRKVIVITQSGAAPPVVIVVPSAPVISAATALVNSATLIFSPPANNGGSAITSYAVTCSTSTNPIANPPQTALLTITSQDPNPTTITVANLTANILYNCTMTATNAIGASAASNAFGVTPIAPTVATAPILTTATALAGGAALSFTMPSSNGGSAITSINAICTAAGQTNRTGTIAVPASPAAAPTSVNVTGMSSGVSYSCTVTATNSVGISPASNALTVTPNSSAPTVSITAPANNAILNTNTPVTITATAAVPMGATTTLTKLEIFDGTTASAPLLYTFTLTGNTSFTGDLNWATPTPGSHSLTAKVTDSLNQTATSAPINITVRAKPSVSLTTLSNFYLAPAGIDLFATATANATPTITAVPTIVSVEFIATNTLTSQETSIATLTTLPHTSRWLNVPVGSYTVIAKATDSTGATATTPPLAITVGTPAGLNITPAAGLNGTAVTDDTTAIYGSYQAPPNSAITINGQLATLTEAGQFFINNVPLPLIGSNTITITLTTQDANTTTQTLTITRLAPPPPPVQPPVQVPPLPPIPIPAIYTATVGEGGIFAPSLNTNYQAPITVSILNGVSPLVGTTLSISCSSGSPATPRPVTNSETTINCLYPETGLYQVSVTVLDMMGGLIYTTVKQVKVENPLEKIRIVRGVYSDLIDRLKASNKTLALNLFFGHAQQKYDDVFTALEGDLVAAANQLGVISRVTVSPETAELVISRTDMNGTNNFSVIMFFGEDGIWRIEGM